MDAARSVVITGGSSGLGMGLAQRHLARGYDVVLMARDPERLRSACASLADAPDCRGRVHHVSCDVGDPERTQTAFARARELVGPPDRLICSAGVLAEKRFDATSPSEIDRVMRINFFGAVHAVHAALPHMRGAESPGVVLIASVAAAMGVYGYSSYCASKHALLGWAESIRYELAPEGFRVQVALPPEFASPMVDPDNIQRSAENIAVARSIPPLRLDQAVAGVMAGIDAGRPTIVPSLAARTVLATHRVLPALTRWVSIRKIRAARRGATG